MLVVPYALGLFCSHIAVSQVLDHRNLFITQSNASEAWKWRWQTCQVVEGRFRTKANIRWPLLWIYCKLTARVMAMLHDDSDCSDSIKFQYSSSVLNDGLMLELRDAIKAQMLMLKDLDKLFQACKPYLMTKNWRNAVKLWSKCFSEATCSIRKIRKWTMNVSNPFSNIISLSHFLATHCHQFNEGHWHCIAGIAKIQGNYMPG